MLGQFSYPKNPLVWVNLLKYVCKRIFVFLNVKKLKIYFPINVVVSVNSQCNKSCDFCHYDGELNGSMAQEFDLDYDKFEKLLENKTLKSAFRLCFYGGEPLLNKDLFKMIDRGKRDGHIVSLVTNGLLLQGRWAEMKKCSLDFITLSFYPEDQGKIENFISTVRKRFFINLLFVVSRRRLPFLSAVFQFASDHQIPMVTIENIHSNGHDTEVPINQNDRNFDRQKKILEKKFGGKMIIRWPSLVPLPDSSGPIKCFQFWSSLFINGEGNFSPCCEWPLSSYQGSIYDRNKNWNSSFMEKLRNRFLSGKVLEECKGCAHLYSADPLRIKK